ncbi:MAG: Gfo/Idh/MocA family oxidoreductase [Cyclobacteriaceae bacterium]
MSEKKIKWGVISTAKIGWEKVIPGIQKSENNEVVAIGSPNHEFAQKISKDLNIARAYDSYEAVLADEEVEAVYIPLPNHIHVQWGMKALEAGKHVLCEKPLSMDYDEGKQLVDASKNYPNQKLMEAFMYRFHPQWLKVKELLAVDSIGEVRSVHTHFSYFNTDPNNIRNRPEVGGGALMDIGCYCISFPRFALEEEPITVQATIERDPEMKTDRMTSAILGFSDDKTATFTCSTQLKPYQRCFIHGRDGHIEIEIPCNAPIDVPCKVWLRTKEHEELFETEIADQYTCQADAFANCIRNDEDMTYHLNDMLGNMKVIDAVVKSASEGVVVKL